HLPQQSLEDFQESLEKALAMDIDHISSYGLILEPKTQFYNMYRKGQLKIPNEDVGEEMYEYILKRMHETELHNIRFQIMVKKDMNQSIIKYIGKTKAIMDLAQGQVVM